MENYTSNNTTQHEATRDNTNATRVQHDKTLVQHDTTRDNTSATRGNTSKTRVQQHKIYFGLLASSLHTRNLVY